MESDKSNQPPITKEFTPLDKGGKNINVKKHKYLDDILPKTFINSYFREVKKSN